MTEHTIEQAQVEANGLTFTYLATGRGPLALCLHGFPDCADGWRPLMASLADAGFHAVAPYMRGYAPTRGSRATGASSRACSWPTPTHCTRRSAATATRS